VNSDCTGTATDTTAGINFNIVTVGGGTEVFGIQTGGAFTDTFDAKKQQTNNTKNTKPPL
jgi:hypothetical protein